MDSILYDPSSTYSYVSIRFAMGLDLVYDVPNSPVYISTLVGDFVMVTYVYRTCSMLFMGLQTWVDLIILDMFDFEIYSWYALVISISYCLILYC